MSGGPGEGEHGQEVPHVEPGEVARIVDREFSPGDRAEALRLLAGYGTESWHREPDRVRLAILKLSGGRLDRLRAHLETAKKDYRDVIASAEYPAYMDTIQPSAAGSPAAQRAILADREQYASWRRKG